MSIKKKNLTEKGVCKVTFKLPETIAEWATSANVVGEFNNWDPTGIRMRKSKTGTFSLSIELPIDKEYQFRYLLDGTRWEIRITSGSPGTMCLILMKMTASAG